MLVTYLFENHEVNVRPNNKQVNNNKILQSSYTSLWEIVIIISGVRIYTTRAKFALYKIGSFNVIESKLQAVIQAKDVTVL